MQEPCLLVLRLLPSVLLSLLQCLSFHLQRTHVTPWFSCHLCPCNTPCLAWPAPVALSAPVIFPAVPSQPRLPYLPPSYSLPCLTRPACPICPCHTPSLGCLPFMLPSYSLPCLARPSCPTCPCHIPRLPYLPLSYLPPCLPCPAPPSHVECSGSSYQDPEAHIFITEEA
ncbi:hypothetical protein Pcinc_023402 [Petrolisthes cinctipes]|uniref:Uncharacterized protein n=1 Tax=Petrolisthes cinctipes TaxID=88211 RepID=A0AAE1KFU3_PETCI|nr:hypothetical protein Pcinc_023402 [Petrolisthes cinctipes]